MDHWEAFGYEAARAREELARDKLNAPAGTILSERETTMHGLNIKARALADWHKADVFHPALNVEGADWDWKMTLAVMKRASQSLTNARQSLSIRPRARAFRGRVYPRLCR